MRILNNVNTSAIGGRSYWAGRAAHFLALVDHAYLYSPPVHFWARKQSLKARGQSVLTHISLMRFKH